MVSLDRLLFDDEEVLYSERKHFGSLVQPAVVTVVALVLAAVAGFAFDPARGDDVVDWIAGVLAALVLLRFVVLVGRWMSERVVLTSRRVVVTSGLFARRVTSIPLARITGAGLDRSLMGRLGRSGSILLDLGDSRAVEIRGVARARTLYQLLMSATSAGERYDTPVTPLPVTAFEDEDTGPLPRVVL